MGGLRRVPIKPPCGAPDVAVAPVLASVLNAHLQGFTHAEWQQLLVMLRRMLANGEALRQARS